jgi:hypothetical protein
MLAIDLRKLFGRERESLGQGTLFVNKKEKESVFLRIKKGKQFYSKENTFLL